MRVVRNLIVFLVVVSAGCITNVPFGTAVVRGLISGPDGPVAGARVRVTSSNPPVSEEPDPGGVESRADGHFGLRVSLSGNDNLDATASVTVTAPEGSGLRDTIVTGVPLMLRRYPGGVTDLDVELEEE